MPPGRPADVHPPNGRPISYALNRYDATQRADFGRLLGVISVSTIRRSCLAD